jgi:thiamine biosynthesis lipoprotein
VTTSRWPLFVPACLLTFSLILVTTAGCRDETPVVTARFTAFDTLIDVSIVGVARDDADRAAHLVEEDFAFMDRAWHAWDPGPLGRVNQLLPTGKAFIAPPSIVPLVRISQDLYARSGGLFNPAIGHLIDLWGFQSDSPEERRPPDDQEIRRLVAAHPGMDNVHVDGLWMRSDNPSVDLDFSAITRGHAIDLVVGHLRELGIRHAMVSAGGTTRVIGERSGQAWRVIVRRPTGSGAMAVLQLRGDESLATVADYDRSFVFEGRTYHRILDPRTGYPASGAHSVTVIHSDAATAEGAATALFIAGPEHWFEVARSLGVRYMLMVDSAGTVVMDPAMAKRAEFVDKGLEIREGPSLVPPAQDGGSKDR